MSRQTTLAELANAFGRCVAANATRGNATLPPPQRGRIRKIARLLDRLSRRPANRTWHRRAARVHRQIDLTLQNQNSRAYPESLWATA